MNRLALAALLALVWVGCGGETPPAANGGGGADREAAPDSDAGERPSWPRDAGRAQDGEAPPVILVSLDTLRSDYLPVYGYAGVETPALDRFAADAVVFERAYAHYPLTFPSHVSLLTGRLPAAADVRGNSRYRLTAELTPYLPEVLQARGYATAGAVSSFVLRSDTGLARGFDVYHDVDLESRPPVTLGSEPLEGGDAPLLEQRAGAETLDLVLPWLRDVGRRDDAPFFLFFHLYEPHLPHTPPEPFRSRWGDTYEGEIAAADHVVGRLFDELRRLGVYDEALILVFSDHGEEFGEHGEEGHGLLLYRQSLQVPLLVKLPASAESTASAGLPWAGTRYPHPVQLADVLPTVLDVLRLGDPTSDSGTLEGGSLDAESQGEPPSGARSLLGQLESWAAGGDDESLAARPIFSETLYPRIHYGWHELTSLVQGDLHLVSGLYAELFDLTSDPAEETDVVRERRREYRALDEIRQALAVPYERPREEEDPETRRRLESLGYLSSGGTRASDAPTRDPRDVVPEFAPRLKAAEDALRAKRHEEAARIYAELVALDDGMPASWQSLGMARLGLDDFDGAWQALERAMRLDPKPITAQMAARALLHLNRLDEAEEHARLALEGHDAGAREVLINVKIAQGRLDEALDWAHRTSGPGVDGTGKEGLAGLFPPTLLRLGKALVQDGRAAEARRVLDVLTRVDPSVASWNEMARLALETGDPAAARRALQQSMALEPRNAGALEWMGLLALQQGRAGAAAQLLEESLSKNAASANAWNLLAVARFQQRDAEGALGAWQEAVRLDPGHLDALYNLGLTAARMGRRDLALRALRQYDEEAAEEASRSAERAAEREDVRRLIQNLTAGGAS